MITLSQPRNSTNYSIAGTDSFRLGSRQLTIKLTRPPKDGRVGSNLQNIEKGMRRIYIPDEGYRFVQADQSGAEALIVAYLCKAGNFRRLFENNIKPHCFVGLHVFENVWKEEFKNSGISIRELVETPVDRLAKNPNWPLVDKKIRESDKWPSERRYYYVSKQICHASNYGMKAGMFQLNTLEKSRGKIVIAKKDAERYLSIYHSLFPEIHEWHYRVEEQLRTTRTLYNLQGFPREFWFPSENCPEHILKKAYSWAPQSTVACITRQAYINLQRYIEEYSLDWHLLADTHDSYMTEVIIGQEQMASDKMAEFLNVELVSPVDGVKFRMKSEIQIGDNWSFAE